MGGRGGSSGGGLGSGSGSGISNSAGGRSMNFTSGQRSTLAYMEHKGVSFYRTDDMSATVTNRNGNLEFVVSGSTTVGGKPIMTSDSFTLQRNGNGYSVTGEVYKGNRRLQGRELDNYARQVVRKLNE